MFKFIKGNTDLLSENISDKKVLVLGSGPSARDVDWSSYEWDVLVTTSFFYLNDYVVSKKPVHITLSDLVDLKDSRLINFLDENPRCTIGFEPKVHPFYESIEFQNFYKKYQSSLKKELRYENTVMRVNKMLKQQATIEKKYKAQEEQLRFETMMKRHWNH